MQHRIIGSLFLSFSLCACAAEPYAFDSFPASKIYNGKPAPIKLNNHTARHFRTVIGSQAKEGPNFAGHYTIVIIGCGSSCGWIAIVDARTGQVYNVPFESVSHIPAFDIPDPVRESKEILDAYGRFDYKLSSSLLIIGGCFNDSSKLCGVRYYHWKNNRLTLLKITHPGVPVQLQKQ